MADLTLSRRSPLTRPLCAILATQARKEAEGGSASANPAHDGEGTDPQPTTPARPAATLRREPLARGVFSFRGPQAVLDPEGASITFRDLLLSCRVMCTIDLVPAITAIGSIVTPIALAWLGLQNNARRKEHATLQTRLDTAIDGESPPST